MDNIIIKFLTYLIKPELLKKLPWKDKKSTSRRFFIISVLYENNYFKILFLINIFSFQIKINNYLNIENIKNLYGSLGLYFFIIFKISSLFL